MTSVAKGSRKPGKQISAVNYDEIYGTYHYGSQLDNFRPMFGHHQNRKYSKLTSNKKLKQNISDDKLSDPNLLEKPHDFGHETALFCIVVSKQCLEMFCLHSLFSNVWSINNNLSISPFILK